jgi:extracellular elastinolytic metalloproteinase
VTLEYLVKDNNSIVLTHIVQIQDDNAGTWYEAFIDAHSGEVVSITDFVSQATVSLIDLVFLVELCVEGHSRFQFLVLPIQKETLLEGFETLQDPADLTVLPNGWDNDGSVTT